VVAGGESSAKPALIQSIIPTQISASVPRFEFPFRTSSHLVAVPLREPARLMPGSHNAFRANPVTIANHSQSRFVTIMLPAELADDTNQTPSRFVSLTTGSHFSFSPARIGINLSRCRSVKTSETNIPTISTPKVMPRRFLAAILTVVHADSL